MAGQTVTKAAENQDIGVKRKSISGLNQTDKKGLRNYQVKHSRSVLLKIRFLYLSGTGGAANECQAPPVYPALQEIENGMDYM